MTCLFLCAFALLCFFHSPLLHSQNHVLSLDGWGDYVEIVNNEGLNVLDTQMTVEAWIRATAYPGERIAFPENSFRKRFNRLCFTHAGRPHKQQS